MRQDPFYNQIIEQLERRLDPDVFESCAADLLREVYPTLVPISGGGDAGMDGAIADGEGEPFPLVTTTSSRVLANLDSNLKSYLKEGGTRRKVVLATSQALTATKIRHLYRRASELGFVLINVHHQEDFANRLYHRPKWCKELLGLVGQLDALSRIPKTTRSQMSHTIVGREEIQAWLLETEEDCLLVGQPASGKTLLLQELTEHKNAYFVNSNDSSAIVREVRAKDPAVLIVDDAHLRLEILVELGQIRRETGASFLILASCWPSFQIIVKLRMSLLDCNMRHLELLTRNEIVQVVKNSGIAGPSRLVHEIVNQSEGRPGLAVTLSQLCLIGGVPEVIRGDAIFAALLDIFDRLALRHEANTIIATIALGGDFGLPIATVSTLLDYKISEVLEVVTKLENSGIIVETPRQNLAIRPEALRHALVKNVFFKGAMSYPVQHLLEKMPNQDDLATTLIGSKARGANISAQLLMPIIENCISSRVWDDYAWLGQEQALWVFTKHPEKFLDVKNALLHHIPEQAIPIMLKAAIGDNRPLHAHPDHPLRFIKDWVQAATHEDEGSLRKRTALLNAVCHWLDQGEDIQIGLVALEAAMSPKFDFTRSDPGSGMNITFHRGLLPLNEIVKIQGFWPKILKTLKGINISDWRPVQRLVRDWAYRGFVKAEVPEDVSEVLQQAACQMVSDIVSLAPQNFAIIHWALQLAKIFKFHLDAPIDRDFIVLYPLREDDDWQTIEKKQRQEVSNLAQKWAKQEPILIARKLASFENSAREAEQISTRWSQLLSQYIADSVDKVMPWLKALLTENVPADLIEPFLVKVATTKEEPWEIIIKSCLENSYYKGIASATILSLIDPPLDLLQQTLEGLGNYNELVKVLCLRNRVSENVLKLLFQHPDSSIRGSAAYGEWFAHPEGLVKSEVYGLWQDVFLTDVANDIHMAHLVKCVLIEKPSLALRWLENYILCDNNAWDLLYFRDSINVAINAVDIETRKQILLQVPHRYFDTDKMLCCLIGDNLDLYQALLSSNELKQFHLSPLARASDDEWCRNSKAELDNIWIEMAKLALQSGYTTLEVVRAVHGGMYFWSGDESDMWNFWGNQFDKLCLNDDELIRQVGAVGRKLAEEHKHVALNQERHEAVYGRLS